MTDDYLAKKIRESSGISVWTGIFLLIAGAGLFLGLTYFDVSLSFSGYAGLFFFLAGGLALAGIWSLWRGLKWRIDPDSHPMIASLDRYGDPATMRRQINEEVRESEPLKVGPASVTKSWMLFPQHDVAPIPVESIAWAYQKVTQHSTNGIKTYKTHQICLRSREGVTIEVESSEDGAMALLKLIADRQPWVKIGFDKESERTFVLDRANFVAWIDRRRDEMENRRPDLG